MQRPTAATRTPRPHPLSGRARTHPRASSQQWWGPWARAWRGEGAAQPCAEGKGQRLGAQRGEGPGLQKPKSPAEVPLVLGHLSSRRCSTDEGGRPGGQRPGRAAGTTCPPPPPPRGSPGTVQFLTNRSVVTRGQSPTARPSQPPPSPPARLQSCPGPAGPGRPAVDMGAPRTCPHSGKPKARMTPDPERQKPDSRKLFFFKLIN